MQEPLNLLVVQPGHLGDALLATSALALLEAALPAARFTYLVGSWSADLARHGPLGARVRPLAFPAFTRQAKASPVAPYLLLARTARALRAERFDAAIFLRPDDWWSALLALAAGIPVRVGADLPLVGPLLSHRTRVDPVAHTALQQQAIARAALSAVGASPPDVPTGGRFVPSTSENEAARALLGHIVTEKDPPVAVHASAGAVLKSWPAVRWTALVNGLIDAGRAIVLSGGPGDGPLLHDICAGLTRPPTATLLGQPIGVLAAAYQRCALVIGPDSGPLHLAQAVGTPTLRLYGPASIAVFGPWPPAPDQRALVTNTLSCVPCGYLTHPPCGAVAMPPCMLALNVDAVLAEALQLLSVRPA
jgi:heptosyltransferase-2/heptosyltransferase-3